MSLHPEASAPSRASFDTSSELRFERFSPKLGATVRGIDLRAPVSPARRDTLRRGLLEHGVLFFRA